tara:strand:- start:161 stop:1198 length:1038 start_codon:yes stop_codon:yes gene_type:complete
MPSYAILAHESFDYILSKTGNMLIRYKPNEVCAVIDRNHYGKTAEDVLGWGGNIPCVLNFDQAKQYAPSHLVIGNAPQGGQLDDKSLIEIEKAINYGCDIISGMHSLLKNDHHLVDIAKKNNVALIDLRNPPNPPHFPMGSWKERKFPVLLVTGSDCDTGKMTTAWEICKELNKRQWNVKFLGTGQTGILLSGNGVPIDAVVSDFMAGEIEYQLDNFSNDTDLVIVEGQGALNNMFYSGVSLGLLHGCMPDFLIMTHEPYRELDVSDYPIPSLKELMNLHLNLLKPFKDSTFVGINLLTIKLNPNEAKKYIQNVNDEFDLPTTDVVRFGSKELISSIQTAIQTWK